ncbi:hypothetical protein K490DRAFT_54549 [Saccharata proteae CBS 121410]|uniref:Uncharacterized protein n=1 Tax=Saccharata proteae CBS 121410 TaxID=1314787 RepID=A0A9P4LYP8_9PEZI|nr:hypothetical protein K490DRAFT_54549 [Saccharata proteae CBS 121410]
MRAQAAAGAQTAGQRQPERQSPADARRQTTTSSTSSTSSTTTQRNGASKTRTRTTIGPGVPGWTVGAAKGSQSPAGGNVVEPELELGTADEGREVVVSPAVPSSQRAWHGHPSLACAFAMA